MNPGDPSLLGILNLSEDSFSDGDSDFDAAVARAIHLHEAGAWAIDVGAVSSNPDGAGLSSEDEIARLAPVVDALNQRRIRVSIDTFAPQTQAWAAPRVAMVNDIRGFPEPSVWPALAAADCKLVVMHQVQSGRADRRVTSAQAVVDGMFAFFEDRLAALQAAGIARERLVVDPGMGFFLGSTPEPSVAVLRALPALRDAMGCEILVGISRKSFLGALLGGRAVADRGPATLAAELWAAPHVQWLRTHDVRALSDALRIQQVLAERYPSSRTKL